MVKMLIDGALVDGPRTMQVIDPSDETIAAEVPDATTADVDRAVAAAAKAFPAWRDSSPEARGAVLTAMANVIIENADELARSEEHTSELQSLMSTSYAVFCLQNKKKTQKQLS